MAAVDPWLWLREGVKLAELARTELARTGLAWAELARTELTRMEQLAGVQMTSELMDVI